MNKVTRRQLMGAAAASALAVRAAAQAPAPPNPNLAQAAEESHRRNSMILASFPLPMSVEPAFQFKA
jgi:hypothetical protein